MQVSEINTDTQILSDHRRNIGKVFKEQRQSLVLSKSEVASRILVNINYITGIEQGDYSVFPARIYALRYFEQYANFLNLKEYDLDESISFK
tara:strand:+ start:251 stop:526 length:276 start_codon:yes stop_codon:yes gene_type:complete